MIAIANEEWSIMPLSMVLEKINSTLFHNDPPDPHNLSSITTEKCQIMLFNRKEMLTFGVSEERGMKCSLYTLKDCNAYSVFYGG